MPTGSVITDRLELRPPVADDLEELFAIQSDPAVWSHYPSLRHTDRAQTRATLERWSRGWSTGGLDTWIVRRIGETEIVGYGGCSVRRDVWNLGYRLAPAAQGRGYATEIAVAAMQRAREVDADRPITARLLEHNRASQRVVLKLGLTLALRGLDGGNPDPHAVRLIYSDRPLSAEQLHGVIP